MATMDASSIKPLIANLERVILGKPEAVTLAVIGLIAGGHVLIEDVPGVGKTVLARALATSCDALFKRIQFTPDLLPTDVTGVSIFNQDSRKFEFQPGPVFANIVLADEINRASPRTQSCLLEAMEERTVSQDGQTRKLPDPFFVIATQNPVELQGTYPLPEAQLDRFLLRIELGYPSEEKEVDILTSQMHSHPLASLKAVLTLADILKLQTAVRDIHIEDTIKHYIVKICAQTRSHDDVLLGASPRASLAMMRAAQAWSFLQGDSYVTPDAVKAVTQAVLYHRLILQPRARVSGIQPTDILRTVLNAIEVPVR